MDRSETGAEIGSQEAAGAADDAIACVRHRSCRGAIDVQNPSWLPRASSASFRKRPPSAKPPPSALRAPSPASGGRKSSVLHLFGERRAQVGRRFHRGDASLLQRRELGRGSALAAGDDRASMAHALARRRGRTRDERDHWFADVLLDELRGLFLGTAPDLADHDDAFGLRIVLEQRQAVDEIHPVDRIATDADHRRLAEADVGGLEHGFVSQRARARHDRDLAGLVDVAGHDADLALAGGDDAGAIGTDQHAVGMILQHVLDAQHVEHRNAFGDRDDHLDAGGRGFQDRVGRKRRRHEDHRRVGAGFVDRIAHGVEHRQADVFGAALAGRDAADQLGAVVQRLLRMEGALLAGEALADDFGVLVDEDGHGYSRIRKNGPRINAHPCAVRGSAILASAFASFNDSIYAAAATAFCAASFRSLAGVILRPELPSNSRPFSTLVPSRRTTTGIFKPTSLTAAMMPSAIRSQRTMPPKMLTRMQLTLGEERISLNAAVTRSFVAPPPTSRKLAGSPPASLITSMVAIARPAPLTMQPMLPSIVT